MAEAAAVRLARQSLPAMSAEPAQMASSLPRGGLRRDRRDGALVREAQRGSAAALEELFRRHWRRAHRAAFLVVGDSAAAEDIAQESFLAAVRALDRFDRRRPFGPWLHRIALNRAIDFARARALRRDRELALAPAQPVTQAPELGGDMLAVLSTLGPEQRAVVVLRYVLEYTPGEIAAMLELPRGTVNSRLRRALDRLRPVVEEGAP